jgi:hypothetical protein
MWNVIDQVVCTQQGAHAQACLLREHTAPSVHSKAERNGAPLTSCAPGGALTLHSRQHNLHCLSYVAGSTRGDADTEVCCCQAQGMRAQR